MQRPEAQKGGVTRGLLEETPALTRRKDGAKFFSQKFEIKFWKPIEEDVSSRVASSDMGSVPGPRKVTVGAGLSVMLFACLLFFGNLDPHAGLRVYCVFELACFVYSPNVIFCPKLLLSSGVRRAGAEVARVPGFCKRWCIHRDSNMRRLCKGRRILCLIAWMRSLKNSVPVSCLLGMCAQ